LANFTSSEHDQQWNSQAVARLSAVVVLVCLAGIGNILVILSVVLNRNMRTTINFYLVNLSVADLLITAWCPAHSYMSQSEGGEYPLPALFCKMTGFYMLLCTVAGVLTLSAISFDRFMAVICPLRTRVTQRKARYFIMFVWSLSFLVASPLLAYRKTNVFKHASESWSECMEAFPTILSCDLDTNKATELQVAKKIYYSLVNIVMFLLPGLLMVLCYTMIVLKLYCSASPGERGGKPPQQSRAKRKVVKLVIVVIAAFFLCWSPHQILMYYAIFFTEAKLPGLVQKYRFWFNMFAYSHAMINPMIYITFNDNFKKAFKKVIFCSNEEIPSEHSTSFQRQFSWKRTFSRRRGTDTGKNIEIRCANPSLGRPLYMTEAPSNWLNRDEGEKVEPRKKTVQRMISWEDSSTRASFPQHRL